MAAQPVSVVLTDESSRITISGGLPLTSIPMLESSEDWFEWERRMQEHFILNGKGDSFRGTAPVQVAGEEPAAFQRRMSHWRVLQDMSCIAIRTRCGYNAYSSVKYVSDAAEIFRVLEENYKPQRIGALQDLCKQFYSIALQDHKGVTEYTSAMRRIDNELKALGTFAAIPETHLVQRYLHGLSPAYNMFHSTFNQTHPHPDRVTLNTVSMATLAEEKRLNFNEDDPSVAMLARIGSRPSIPSAGTGGNMRSVEVKYCDFCKKTGHWADKCYVKHPHLKRSQSDPSLRKSSSSQGKQTLRSKPSFKRQRKDSDDDEGKDFAAMIMHFVGMASSAPVRTSDWILDTGCTQHLCNNEKAFSSLNQLAQPKRVAGINGVSVLTKGGDVRIACVFEGERISLLLKDVAYFLQLFLNLISISAFIDAGASPKFTKDDMTISHKTGN